jgi:hypothetical protein
MLSTITIETRNQSYEEIKPEIPNRQEQCYNTLKQLGEATANELAMEMFNKGITPYFSRNFVHPRLNELVSQNKIIVLSKKKDLISNKTCAVYAINK